MMIQNRQEKRNTRRCFVFVLTIFAAQIGCSAGGENSSTITSSNGTGKEINKNVDSQNKSGNENSIAAENLDANDGRLDIEKSLNVREYFFRLPQEYFSVPGCKSKDGPECQVAKRKYLEKYLAKEDLGRGYLEGGRSDSEEKFWMTLFKRVGGSPLVGLSVASKNGKYSKFLSINKGEWEDVSIEIIPKYSSANIYEIPATGANVGVYAKRILEQREGFEVSEKGEKLYDLEWSGKEFLIKE